MIAWTRGAFVLSLLAAAVACVEAAGPSYGNIGDDPGPQDPDPPRDASARDSAQDAEAISDSGADTPDADQ